MHASVEYIENSMHHWAADSTTLLLAGVAKHLLGKGHII